MQMVSTSQLSKERIEWIDSIKGFLIWMVVLGHLCGGGVGKTTHYLIYSIHMPMFIFISGLFSKKRYRLSQVFCDYIMPYLVFDLLYVIYCNVIGRGASWNLLTPSYLYWYILCIALLRLLSSYVNRLVILSISLIASFLFILFDSEETWRLLSIGRVFMMYPIYYLGTIVPYDFLKRMRNKKVISSLIGCICTITMFVLLKCNIIPCEWATHDYYSDVTTLLYKYLFMIMTVGVFISLNAILPGSGFLRKWGRNSLLVYLLHPYAIEIVKFFMNRNYLSDTTKYIIMLTGSIAITSLLSLDTVRKYYDKAINALLKPIRHIVNTKP